MTVHVHLAETDPAETRQIAADAARAHMVVAALQLHDIGGMAAVLDGLLLAKREVVLRRCPAGWVA